MTYVKMMASPSLATGVISGVLIVDLIGMVYLNPKSHALSMDYLESTSPLVVQQPLAARYAPHNLSLTAAPVPQNFVAMYLVRQI